VPLLRSSLNEKEDPVIKVSVFERGKVSQPNGVEYIPMANALVNLVNRLTGDTRITCIGLKILTLDCPITNECVEFEGDEDDMNLLLRVGHLYLLAC